MLCNAIGFITITSQESLLRELVIVIIVSGGVCL
jgi:hypothetical protein